MRLQEFSSIVKEYYESEPWRKTMQSVDAMQKMTEMKVPEMLYVIPAGTIVHLEKALDPAFPSVTPRYRYCTDRTVTYEEEDLREIDGLGMYRFELPTNDRNVLYLTVLKKHINEVSKPHYNYRRQHR